MMGALPRFAAALAVAVLASAVPATAVPAAAAPGPAQAPEYWFDQWQVPQLWRSGARGQGVVIAEVDTGVNASLPELAGKILPGKDFGEGGDGHVDRDKDAFGHGTAMASIMVGSPGPRDITGLAPSAKILPVAVPLTGTTDATGEDHLATAIRWSVDHGAKIISMSLGGVRRQAQQPDPCPAPEQQAIYYALRKGAVLLAASGNRGKSDSAVEEPGVCLGVIAVGAVDASGTVASFSSRHPYLTLAAPGVKIASLSRIPGAAYKGNGTSQATAITSAVVALVWSKYPKLSGRQVVARLLATLDRHSATPSPAYGYGIVNAHRAVTGTVPAGAPNPVYAAVAPFLARESELTHRDVMARPRPAATDGPKRGVFRAGHPPGRLSAAVLLPAGVSLAGLLALIILGVVGSRSRRRSGSWRGDVTTSAGSVPAAPVADSTGLVWHEIHYSRAPPEPPGARGPEEAGEQAQRAPPG